MYIKWSWINFIRCFHNIEIEIWTFYTIKISRKMECIMCIQVCLFAHSRFGFIFSIYSLHFLLMFLYFSSKKGYFFCIYYWTFFNRVNPRFLFLYFCNDISRNVTGTKRNSVIQYSGDTRCFKLNVTYEDSTCSYLISHSKRTNLLRNFPLNTIHAFWHYSTTKLSSSVLIKFLKSNNSNWV